MDAIVVWDRFPFLWDVDDFTFITVESHLPVIFPGLKTIKIVLKLKSSGRQDGAIQKAIISEEPNH